MEKPLSPWQVIEKLRAAKGIPKKALADKLQINYNYLVDLLNGRYQSNIDDEKIRIISSVLDIPINNLLDELHDIHPNDTAPAALEKAPMPAPPPPAEPPQAPLVKIPVFRIISGSKIDPFFNQSLLWAQKEKEMEFLCGPLVEPALGEPPIRIAVKLEDNSLFPPCLAGSAFIVDTQIKPRIGDIVLAVLQNYRAWIIELNKMDSLPEEKFIFRPYNADYEPIMIARKDVLAIYPVVWIHPA
ncbi:MAG: LexA family transcriptional regulator [Planctomycetes bacterium]|nr:LexA family transcriptional regulator [Planctomycetota bacterium]